MRQVQPEDQRKSGCRGEGNNYGSYKVRREAVIHTSYIANSSAGREMRDEMGVE